MQPNDPTVHEVFAEWSLYEKIIHFDYMQHQAMIAFIRKVVSECSVPLHVLDLGCGDGWMASQGLQEATLASYTGVDLSEAATQSVQQNLGPLVENISLITGDLGQVLQRKLPRQPNLILASYSLHHFKEAQQPEIIQSCASQLGEGGLLLWIDLCRHDQETREDYLHRFWSTTLNDWHHLTEGEVMEVQQHMQSSDYPLSKQEKKIAVEAAGLQSYGEGFCNEYYAADCTSLN